MRNLNTIIIATLMTLTTTTVTAGEISRNGGVVEMNTTKVFETNAVSSKNSAYQLGFNQLKTILNSMQSNDANSAHLKGKAYVTVSERMNVSGQIEYIGRAVVPLHYQENDSDK